MADRHPFSMPLSIKVLSTANIVVGVLLVVGAFILTQLLTSLRDTADKLREADINLAKQITSVQMLFATQYVTREEFQFEIKRLRESLLQK